MRNFIERLIIRIGRISLEPSETPGDDVDSDGSELSTVSKISSVSMLSTQSERPRATRKHG